MADAKKDFDSAVSRMAEANKRGDKAAFNKANEDAMNAQKRKQDEDKKKGPQSLASRLLGGS